MNGYLKMDARDARWPIATALLSIALGAAIPAIHITGHTALVASAVAALPLLYVVAERWPTWLLGAFVAVQPLEAFEIQTPFGSYSVGLAILATLCLARAPIFFDAMKTNSVLRRASIMLGLWLVAIYPLKESYLGHSAFRETLTMASFVAVYMVAASMPLTMETLRRCATGAFVALCFVAACGAAASYGWIHLPARVEAARTLLGFKSPLLRNYGINIPYDAVTLLFPIAAAYFSVRFVRRDHRARAFWALAALAAATLYVFQARSLLLQLALAVTVALIVVRRRLAPGVVAIAAPALVYLYERLAAADHLSTGARSASDLAVIHTAVAHPAHYLAGTNETQVFAQAVNATSYGAAFAGKSDAIHNLFLSNLVSGGYVLFALIAAAYYLGIRTAWRRWRRDRDDPVAQIVLAAMTLVLLAVSLEPVAADIAGSWLVLGFAVAAGESVHLRRSG